MDETPIKTYKYKIIKQSKKWTKFSLKLTNEISSIRVLWKNLVMRSLVKWYNKTTYNAFKLILDCEYYTMFLPDNINSTPPLMNETLLQMQSILYEKNERLNFAILCQKSVKR